MQRLLAILVSFLLLTTSSMSGATVACSPPLFTLHDIVYSSYMVYSTPAHLAVAGGSVNFNLTNAAVPYTTHCGAFGSRLFNFFYGEFVYQCDMSSGDGTSQIAIASFTFSEPDGRFNVNQTWSCQSSEDNKTETLLGIGSGIVTLDCQTNVSTNPNWTIGEIYSYTSTTCKPVDLQITPTTIETITATASSVTTSNMPSSTSTGSIGADTATSVPTASTPVNGTGSSLASPTTTATVISVTIGMTSSSIINGKANSTASSTATGPTGMITTGDAGNVEGRWLVSTVAFVAISGALLL